ncbi:MAG: DNA-3-methyladenine glycosylase I [Endozoicomonas sp. (ex Botrylloides leachii)]|nr:DNA-3-methyladenine glycosylase I [Endozoicomonas sp. (ex Botrylloides leachii)]
MMKQRCSWCLSDPLYISYHDDEWGRPCHDDHKLFEFLLLEGAQAGLSWLIILKKREGYRKAFCQFDAEKVARFNANDIERLMKNPAIIRNHLKIKSAIKNAQAFLKLQEQHNGFHNFLWQFVDGCPIMRQPKTLSAIPASTPESDQLSKALKKAGCSFFGSITCYAYMQAMGLVNDHISQCFCVSEKCKTSISI